MPLRVNIETTYEIQPHEIAEILDEANSEYQADVFTVLADAMGQWRKPYVFQIHEIVPQLSNDARQMFMDFAEYVEAYRTEPWVSSRGRHPMTRTTTNHCTQLGPGDIGRRDPLDCDEDRPITVEDDRRMRAALAQAKSSAWRAMSDLDRITLRHEPDEDPTLFDDLRVPLREAKETYRILNDSMKGMDDE